MRANRDINHLVPGLRRGDNAAFRSLIRELAQPLARYVMPRLRDEAAAQDVVQETFLRVFKSRRQLRKEGALRGYCYRIAANMALNHLRAMDRRSRHEQEKAAMTLGIADNDPGGAAVAREAWHLTASLPDAQRTVVELRFGHGLGVKDAAAALELPESTFRDREAAALKRLREMLTARKVSPGALAPGMLEATLEQVQAPATLAISSNFATQVEVMVMASISTKTAGVGALAAAILLLVMGFGIASVMVFGPDLWPWTEPAGTRGYGGESLEAELAADSCAPEKTAGRVEVRTGPDGNPRSDPDGNPHSDPDEGVEATAADSTPGPVVKAPGASASNAAGDSPAAADSGVFFGVTIRGRVLDSAGEGLPGALIYAVDTAYFKKMLPDNHSIARAEGFAFGEAMQSGLNGEFDGSARVAVREPSSQYAMVAFLEGYVGGFSSNYTVLKDDSRSTATLKMYRPSSIEGQVVFADRATPVVGVEVELRLDGPRSDGNHWRGGRSRCTTGTDGRFLFENLTPGYGRLRILESEAHPGYEQSARPEGQFRLVEGERVSDAMLVYASYVRILFRVEQEVKGVLEVMQYIVDPDGYSGGGGEVSKDKEGRYVLTGVDIAVNYLTLDAPGFLTTEIRISITPDEDLDLGTISLKEGLTLRGRISDPDGAPLAGAGISLTAADSFWGNSKSARCDERGEFEIRAVEAGRYVYRASAEGFAETTGRVTLTKAGENTFLSISLTRGGTLAGVVTIAGEAPDPGLLPKSDAGGRELLVCMLRTDVPNKDTYVYGGSWDATIIRRALPDGEGAFVFENVPPGKYAVFVRFRGRLAVVDPVTVHSEARTVVELDIARAASVQGTLYGRDGRRMPGASIHLVRGEWLRNSHMWSRAPTATTGEEGSFLFEEVAPGAHYLVTPEDGTSVRLDLQSFINKRGVFVRAGDRHAKDIHLSIGKGVKLRVRPTLNGAAVFTNISLTSATDGLRAHAQPDSYGWSEFFDLPNGRYTLWAYTHEVPAISREIVIDGLEDVVVVEGDHATYTVRGSLGFPDGRSVDPADVELELKADPSTSHPADGWWPTGRLWRASSRDRNNFTFRNVIPGRYFLVATHPDFVKFVATIEVTEDLRVDLQLGGEPGGLRARLKSVQGEAASGKVYVDGYHHLWKIKLSDEGGVVASREFWEIGETDLFGSLKPGSYQLRVTSSLTETWTRTVQVRAGEVTDVDVELVPFPVLEIEILNDDLNPLDVFGAVVSLKDSNGTAVPLPVVNLLPGQLRMGSMIITLRLAAEGSYTARIEVKGYVPYEFAVKLGRGETLRRKVTLAHE